MYGKRSACFTQTWGELFQDFIDFLDTEILGKFRFMAFLLRLKLGIRCFLSDIRAAQLILEPGCSVEGGVKADYLLQTGNWMVRWISDMSKILVSWLRLLRSHNQIPQHEMTNRTSKNADSRWQMQSRETLAKLTLHIKLTTANLQFSL